MSEVGVGRRRQVSNPPRNERREKCRGLLGVRKGSKDVISSSKALIQVGAPAKKKVLRMYPKRLSQKLRWAGSEKQSKYKVFCKNMGFQGY